MKKEIIAILLLFSVITTASSCVKQNNSAQNQTDPNEEFFHIIPDNGDEVCSPYFFVKSNDPEKSWMPLKSTRAYVKITGNIADVKVEQIYKNESDRSLDAIYIFPGSTRAAVYGLDMTIGKRVIHAKVKEREQARKDFEQARQAGKRATLLEQDRPNVFKTEVTNIRPGDEIKVEMYYTELLEYRDKIYEFVYPTAVGPRYSTANEEYVQKSIEQLMSKHQPKFNVQVVIDGAIPVQTVASSSHAISMKKVSETSTVVAMQNPLDEKLGKDFVLQYSLQGKEVMGGLTLYEHNNEKFFLLMMQPPKKTKESLIMPREYIFIVDVSGSMHGYPLEVSKGILTRLISSLKPTDRFNVLLFESSNAMLSKTSMPATPENIQKAIRVIDQQRGSGGTELYPALQTAFNYKDPALDNYARTFIIATDGYVSVESKVFQLIKDNLNKANFVPLGIGTSVNRYLIEGMAWAGASEPFIIENQTQAEEVGNRLIQTISQPLFSHINIDWGDFQAYDTYPQQVPDIFSDRPITVFGKYKGTAKGYISLKGETAMGEFTIKFPVASASKTGNQALRYLWARNKIKYLSDYAPFFESERQYYYSYNNNEISDKNKHEITKLGLEYNLLTAFTSFLAIDDDAHVEENTKLLDQISLSPPVKSTVESREIIIQEDILFVEEVKDKYEAQPLMMAETMPAFSGGDQKLLEFIRQHLTYPQAAIENGISGRVIVKFCVTANGDIEDITIVRSLSPECDQEALRIMKLMPKWIPGKQNGKPVAVYYTLPIQFRLATE